MTRLARIQDIFRRCAMAAGVLLMLCQQAHADQALKPLRILYFDRPPFHFMADGHLQGSLVAPVNEALDRAGVSYVWQNVPAKRILDDIKQGGRICSPGWIKTAQRDAIAKFSRAFFEAPKGYALISENIAVPDQYSLVGLLALVPNLFVKDGLSFTPFIDGLINELPAGRLHRTTFDNDIIARFVAEDGNGMMLADEIEVAFLKRPGLHKVKLTDVFDVPPLRLMCSRDVTDQEIALINDHLPQIFQPEKPVMLKLISEDYPPFNMRDEQSNAFIGTSTQIIEEALNSAGIRFSITAMPWARALMTVRSEKETCAFSVSRTPEREDLFKWVSILAENKWVLFANRSRGLKISALEQARPLVIGTYVGDAIEKFLNQNGYRIQVTGSDELNLDKLENNRIDLWATGELVGRHFIAKHNHTGFEKVLDFGKTKMYLACNLDLPDAIARQIALAIAKDHPASGGGGPVLNHHASPN